MNLFESNISIDDAYYLDKVLDHCINNDSSFTKNDYIDLIGESDYNDRQIREEMECLSSIISHYNALKASEHNGHIYFTKNNNSVNFSAYGGFRQIYEEQVKAKNRDELEIELLNKKIKQIRINKIMSILSLIIAFISLALCIYQQFF